jgi:outer membrane receptor for ferric coprogen and ferric-rhodotorulic acid
LSKLTKGVRYALLGTAVGITATAQSEEVMQLDALSVTAETSGDKRDAEAYQADISRSASGLTLEARETPQTVSVFSTQRIQDQKLNTLNDVLSQTSGVSVKEYDSARQYYYSRGFEINTIMIDGVPTLFDPGWGTGENSANTAIYDQVEVIKGSTGLTTGSGNPSAAVNLIRKRADNTEFEGTAELTLGSRNERNAEVDVSSGLNQSGSLRGRAVVAHNEEDSFREIGDSEQNVVYVTAEADLNENTLLTVGASYQDNTNNAPTWGGIPGWYSDGTRSDYSRSKTTSADWAYWNTQHTNVFAELKYNLDDTWTLNGRLNYGSNTGDSRLLYVYGNPDKETGAGIFPYAGGNFSTDTSYSMVDLFISGTYELFGYNQPLSFGISSSVRDFTSDSAFATSVEPIDDFNAWDGKDYPEHVWGESFLYEEFTDTQVAAYGSTRIQFSDSFSTVAGIRITDQEVDRKEAAYNDAEVIEHTGIVTPYLGLLYNLTEDLTGYASYTEIFTPQEERNRNGSHLDPIVGRSAELGMKAGFNDDRMIASFALFRTVQDNLAVADGTNVVAGTTDQAYKESEGATSRGYEIEVTGEVMENWEAQVGFTSYEVKDADGEKINTEQPRKILKTYTRYQLPGELSAFTVGGGVNWEGDSYATATNPVSGASERVEQEAFALVSLMAKYQVTPEFTTQLNIDNLTDETYYTNIGTFGQIAYGSPRTVSLTATYEF